MKSALFTLVIAIVVALGGTTARAESVDWSQYIDKDAQARPATKPANTRVTKRVAAKPKAKARTKAKTNTKAKRRR